MSQRRCFVSATNCWTATVWLAVLLLGVTSHLYAADGDTDKASQDASLSVAPLTHTEYDKARPSWIDAAQSRDHDNDLLPVSSVPCREEKLCDEALKVALRAATETYAESLTGNEQVETWLKLDDEWINKRRDKEMHYHGTVTIGNETFYESATMLRFDENDRKEILRQWEQLQVSQRLIVLTIVGLVVVCGLIGSAAILSVIVRRAEQRVAAA